MYKLKFSRTSSNSVRIKGEDTDTFSNLKKILFHR